MGGLETVIRVALPSELMNDLFSSWYGKLSSFRTSDASELAWDRAKSPIQMNNCGIMLTGSWLYDGLSMKGYRGACCPL
jgi:hypothetical protein